MCNSEKKAKIPFEGMIITPEDEEPYVMIEGYKCRGFIEQRDGSLKQIEAMPPEERVVECQKLTNKLAQAWGEMLLKRYERLGHF